VCDSLDQVAHYHNLGLKLGASSLTRLLAGTEERTIIFIVELTKCEIHDVLKYQIIMQNCVSITVDYITTINIKILQ
jgi:hypothetical protein